MHKKFKMLIIDDETDLGDMMCILLKILISRYPGL